MNEDKEELTPEEQQELASALGLGFPKSSEKQNIFAFFNKVLSTEDSTKVANLSEEELASVRTWKSAALYAEMMAFEKITKYLNREAEIILATSDSKKGFLITSAITQKRQFEAQTKLKTRGKKRWFQKKEENE